MPKPSTADELQRALEVLADAPDGVTMSMMMAYGFSSNLLAHLIKAELVTVHSEQVERGGRLVEIRRLRITDDRRGRYRRRNGRRRPGGLVQAIKRILRAVRRPD